MITYQVKVEPFKIIIFVAIHPDLSHTNGIFLHDVNTRSPLIRATRSKYVPNVRAKHYFKRSSTHPCLIIKKLINKDKVCRYDTSN